jgi:hypothetical protein
VRLRGVGQLLAELDTRCRSIGRAALRSRAEWLRGQGLPADIAGPVARISYGFRSLDIVETAHASDHDVDEVAGVYFRSRPSSRPRPPDVHRRGRHGRPPTAVGARDPVPGGYQPLTQRVQEHTRDRAYRYGLIRGAAAVRRFKLRFGLWVPIGASPEAREVRPMVSKW